jgi:hypothetical protein
MKIISIVVISLAISITSNSQSVDCKKFRNGTFYYPGMPEVSSIRKNSIQESYRDGNLEMRWKVNWISDCKYEMICEKVWTNSSPIRKGDRIVAVITHTEGNCYTASIIFYTAENPEGEILPAGQLCIKNGSVSK